MGKLAPLYNNKSFFNIRPSHLDRMRAFRDCAGGKDVVGYLHRPSFLCSTDGQ